MTPYEFRRSHDLPEDWLPACLGRVDNPCSMCRKWRATVMEEPRGAEPYYFATDAAGRLEIAGQMEKGELPGIMLPIPPAREVAPGDWLQSLNSAERKEIAIYRGLFSYFPDALAAVARHSVRSNEKHNPGTEPHWAREKSKDHKDCIARHLIGVGGFDEGQRHSVGLAWRALANLQLEIEDALQRGEKV